MNSINLVGNVTRDAELRTFQKDGKECTVAKFSLAIYRNKTTTDFIDIDAFDWAAEAAEKFAVKGAKVAVTGSLLQDSWTDGDGNARKGHRVRADRVYPCGAKPEAERELVGAVAATVVDDSDIPF
jgi:single-strand DNA-binding protein